jgi:hypothetical protein
MKHGAPKKLFKGEETVNLAREARESHRPISETDTLHLLGLRALQVLVAVVGIGT